MTKAGAVVAAARRARGEMETPEVYRQTVAAQGFDPAAPIPMPVMTKRQRHKAGRLTQAVFNTIVYNPETQEATVNTDAIPMTMNTDELPIVVSDGEPEMSAELQEEARRNGLL